LDNKLDINVKHSFMCITLLASLAVRRDSTRLHTSIFPPLFCLFCLHLHNKYSIDVYGCWASLKFIS